MAKKGDRQRFCKHGHDTDIVGRVKANHMCSECARENVRKYHVKHRDRLNKHRAELRLDRTSEQIEQDRIRQREYDISRAGHDRHNKKNRRAYSQKIQQALTPQQKRVKNIKAIYKIDAAEYDRMFAEQGGCCAICRQPERMKLRGRIAPLAIDHDHRADRIRALLCTRCNRALGLLNDDPSVVFAAVEYLIKHTDGVALLKEAYADVLERQIA